MCSRFYSDLTVIENTQVTSAVLTPAAAAGEPCRYTAQGCVSQGSAPSLCLAIVAGWPGLVVVSDA